MKTEDLIGRLAGDLRPVRRLAHPLRRAAMWLAFAAVLAAAAVAWYGPRHDLMERLGRPHEVAQLIFAVATGVLAAVAAFELSLPDRSARWALLPLPAAAAWVSSLGWGCLADLARVGPQALVLGTSWGCLRFIVMLGVPLALSMVWMLRHAGPIRPVPVAVMGGLAGAALSGAALSMFHHLDAAAMVLAWHGGSTLLVLAVFVVFGRAWGARAAPRFTPA
ncbi:NrsF family protein [Roseomonas sp. HF4]|uniref:NrsF family protein n=1 Tax=Roseomonas sp. HF4 TaxID=2562313 RepID=UPI0010BFF104|nr:NrsF family protein [Roseomonas sp. HF4]